MPIAFRRTFSVALIVMQIALFTTIEKAGDKIIESGAHHAGRVSAADWARSPHDTWEPAG